ncbi:hypothetical protein BOTNAR_0031g00140 [Botryotinia narcissicola]|uniref:Uncharacterized protein n=1 Tax=Botryotinia narcissicola TaxID=278944 RepID=A0A4Z1J2V2_9HELO|nr:hypothetical protein BOTNAR_0031g00140 [Botryotinia narcissicola]
MSAAITPAKGMGGRKLKSWELAIQTPVDIHSNMSDFLAHIADEPLGPGLAAIANQLSQMYEANDNDARHFTHTLQRRFQKECDGYETDTARFIEDLALGLQTRIESLDKTMPIPGITNNSLGNQDSEAKKKRTAVFVDQERTLFNLFWEIKRSIDSKERTLDEVTSTLALQTPIRTTAPNSFSSARTMLPFSPTRSMTTPSIERPMGPERTPSNKRQRTVDHYDLTASPESPERY